MSETKKKEETTVFEVAERLGRRGFLRKLTMGAVGLATALVGLGPKSAEAIVQRACCFLCLSPSSCSGACCWQWSCCYEPDQNRAYFCKECYSSSSFCNGGCTGVVCSQAIRTQFIC